MKFKPGIPIVAVAAAGLWTPAMAAGGPPATTPPASATPDAAAAVTQPAATQTGSQLVDQVTLFRQIKGLSLTADQLRTIGAALQQLDRAEASFRARQDAATGPIREQLQRVHTALLEGRTPDKADLDAVTQVQTTLQPLSQQVKDLRQKTLDTIRTTLTAAQLQVVRIDLGLNTNTPAVGVNGAAGNGGPGFGGPGAGGPGFGGPGAGGPGYGGVPGGAGQPGAGQPGGGGRGWGGNRNPQQMIGGMMDRMRSMPQDRYTRMRNFMPRIMGRMMGQDPNSADVQAAVQNLQAQMDQVRQMPDDQYKTSRDQMAQNFVQQYHIPATMPNGGVGPGGGPGGGGFGGPGGGPGGWGGRGGFATIMESADNEAIRRFFLQPNALKYFAARLAPAPAP